MKILLDTHIWLWQVMEPERLSRRASKALNEPDNNLFLSPISVWETLVLAKRGRLDLRPDPVSWVRAALAASPITMAEITHEIAIRSVDLAGLNTNDPADRFLVATCLVNEMVLLTADRAIHNCRLLPVIW